MEEGAGEMMECVQKMEKELTPAGIHMTEQDRTDLERFRAALAKLNSRQKREVIGLLLETPDTP